MSKPINGETMRGGIQDMSIPYVKTLLIGKVKQVDDSKSKEEAWSSAIFKEPVDEPVWLGVNGLTGDEVADTKHHGGPDKAVFAYPVEHYDYWAEELSTTDMGIGAMGENLAIQDMDERKVCIGDIYRYGDAVIQVAQPREPCWKPARRFGEKDLAKLISSTGRTGWYFRVLEEGEVQGGQTITFMERPSSRWTVEACHEIVSGSNEDRELTRELSTSPFLAEDLRESLHKRLEEK